MDASAIEEIAARHPAAFRSSFWKRYSAPIGILACILYTLYCWWFFSVGAVLQQANWRLAGAYLADWVSYEIRPDIEFQNGYLTIGYSRFSELGRESQSGLGDQGDGDHRAAGRGQARAGPAPAKPATDSFMAPGAPTAENPAPTAGEAASAAPRSVREEAIVKATVELGNGRIVVTPRSDHRHARRRNGGPRYRQGRLRDAALAAARLDRAAQAGRDRLCLVRRFRPRRSAERRGGGLEALPRLGQLRVRHQFAVLGKVVWRGRLADRLGSAHRSGAVERLARLGQHLEQQRMAAWRRLAEAAADHRHGLRRHGVRVDRGVPAGLRWRPATSRRTALPTRGSSASSISCARSTC